MQATRRTRFATFPPYLTVVIKRCVRAVMAICVREGSGCLLARVINPNETPSPDIKFHSYYVAEDWTAKKMEVEVPVPDTLDLEALRGAGPAPGEVLQPEEEANTQGGQQGGAAATAPTPDDAIVAALVSMGFSENGSKRAGERGVRTCGL